MPHPAVIEQLLAVVRSDHDQGVGEHPPRLERAEETTEFAIQRVDLRVVERLDDLQGSGIGPGPAPTRVTVEQHLTEQPVSRRRLGAPAHRLPVRFLGRLIGRVRLHVVQVEKRRLRRQTRSLIEPRQCRGIQFVGPRLRLEDAFPARRLARQHLVRLKPLRVADLPRQRWVRRKARRRIPGVAQHLRHGQLVR